MQVNNSLKLLVAAGLAMSVAACSSSKHRPDVDNAFAAQAQGIGNGPFLNADYMARKVGVEKNTIYFEFDKSYVQPEYMNIVEANARYLKSHPSAKVRLEGNTDPRGSREYNIGLGQRRASSVAQQLASMGVPANQFITISYGQERLVSMDESAYNLDRRVDFIYMSE